MATNTAASFTNHTGNGSTDNFSISFSYISTSEIDVTVGGVLKTLGTHYTVNGATITFTSGNIPANGAAIKFQRDTDISTKKVDFQDGSVLTESDLDTNSDQVLFAQQEITDKLAGIEEGATADQTDEEIRTAVENASDSNVFTDADHTKLNNIEANATQDQTASEIRTLVESASDSNVFTDADHTKLNNIEDNATADQTNAEIRAAVEAASDSNVFTDAEKTKLSNLGSLNALSDVNTSGVADGKILKYDNSSSAFVIADETGGGGGGSSTFTGLSDTPANFGSAAGKTVKVNAAGNALEFVTVTTPTQDIVDDTTPQLGGNLDVQTNEITTSTTNGNIKLNPNGTGVVEVKGDGTTNGTVGTLQLNCSNNNHGVKIASPPHSAGQSYTLTLPSSIVDDGFLKTNSSGNLSFETINNQTLTAPNGQTRILVDNTDINIGYAPLKFDTDPNNIFNIKIQGPTTLTKNSSFTLPEDGSNGQFLKTNGNGVLSFADGGGGATGGGGEKIFHENENSMDQDYTIGNGTANINAGVFGPLTINATLTIPANSVLSIV